MKNMKVNGLSFTHKASLPTDAREGDFCIHNGELKVHNGSAWQVVQRTDSSQSGPTYTVSYNYNNASSGGIADNNQYQSGASVTVKDQGTLARPGYTFVNWNTAANGSGTSHAALSQFNIVANVTLYAQWALVSGYYPIVYVATGASGSVPFDSYGYAVDDLVPVQTPSVLTKTDSYAAGYVFDHWNVSSSATWDSPGTTGVDAWQPGTSIPMIEGGRTLYAIWKPEYRLTYVANFPTETGAGGTAPVDSTLYLVNDQATLASQGSLNIIGYAFVGWSESGIAPEANSPVSMTANTTLKAIWRQLYTLTYNNGQIAVSGTVPTDSNFYNGPGHTDSYAVVMGPNTLACTGYAFLGWGAAPDGGVTHFESTQFIFTDGIYGNTLYAQWEHLYQVTYDMGGGGGIENPTDSSWYAVGDSVTVMSATGILKEGYYYVGWDDGSGSHLGVGTYSSYTNMVSGGLTLTAGWEQLWQVTYHAGAATGGQVPTDYTYYAYTDSIASSLGAGALATVLDNTGGLSRSGYAFDGWVDGANNPFPARNSVDSTSKDLTAYWLPPPSGGGFNPDAVDYAAPYSGRIGAAYATGVVTSWQVSNGVFSIDVDGVVSTAVGLTEGDYSFNILAENAAGGLWINGLSIHVS